MIFYPLACSRKVVVRPFLAATSFSIRAKGDLVC